MRPGRGHPANDKTKDFLGTLCSCPPLPPSMAPQDPKLGASLPVSAMQVAPLPRWPAELGALAQTLTPTWSSHPCNGQSSQYHRERKNKTPQLPNATSCV